MNNSWNTIEEQINNSHSRVNNVLAKKTLSKKAGFWKEHKTASILGAFGLLLLIVSFAVPDTVKFVASILELPDIGGGVEEETPITPIIDTPEIVAETEEPDFAYKAEEVDVVPLSIPETTIEELAPLSVPETTIEDVATPSLEAETSNEPTTLSEEPATINPFLSLSSTTVDTNIDEKEGEASPETEVESIAPPVENVSIEEEINPFIKEETIGTADVEDTNPFLIIKEDEDTAPVIKDEDTKDEEMHGTYDEDEVPLTEPDYLIPVEPIADETDEEAFPFRENTHTYDKSTPAFNGEMGDPLGEGELITSGEEGEDNIVVETAEGTSIYKGILRPSSSKSNSKYPFAFWLDLGEEDRIKLETNRDLRSVLGKEISVEISGTKENFVLLAVYYDEGKQLPKTGPALPVIITLSLFMALGATKFFRRSAF